VLTVFALIPTTARDPVASNRGNMYHRRSPTERARPDRSASTRSAGASGCMTNDNNPVRASSGRVADIVRAASPIGTGSPTVRRLRASKPTMRITPSAAMNTNRPRA
jgi:hypothetical protein